MPLKVRLPSRFKATMFHEMKAAYQVKGVGGDLAGSSGVGEVVC